jgi:hypothetical protein
MPGVNPPPGDMKNFLAQMRLYGVQVRVRKINLNSFLYAPVLRLCCAALQISSSMLSYAILSIHRQGPAMT